MHEPCGRAAGDPGMSRREKSDARRKERKLRRQRLRPLRRRRLFALLLIVGAGALIGRHGGNASYLLFWATLLPPLYALIWRLIAAKRFRALIEVDTASALRGERLGCTLTLVNNSFLPIPEIYVRMGGRRVRFEEDERMRISLAPGEVRKLRFSPLCTHCGKTDVGAVLLRLRDPFALAERRVTAMESVQVEPRLVRISQLLISQPEEREQRPASRMYLGDRVPSGELRAYQPGDDVRRVNWKVSALQGRPMLRVTEPEGRDALVLLPDMRKALPADETENLVQDSIREGSLTLADWFLRRGIPLYVLPDEYRAVLVRTSADLNRLRALMGGDCFTGFHRPDEMMERDLAKGQPARRYILLTWEVDALLLQRAARCIALGAEVTLLCIGGDESVRQQAEAVGRLEYHAITVRQDIFAVLGGGEEGVL